MLWKLRDEAGIKQWNEHERVGRDASWNVKRLEQTLMVVIENTEKTESNKSRLAGINHSWNFYFNDLLIPFCFL